MSKKLVLCVLFLILVQSGLNYMTVTSHGELKETIRRERVIIKKLQSVTRNQNAIIGGLRNMIHVINKNVEDIGELYDRKSSQESK